MIHYYDQAVVVEHKFLGSLNDQLAGLRLLPEEQLDIDSFEATIPLKKETFYDVIIISSYTKINDSTG